MHNSLSIVTAFSNLVLKAVTSKGQENKLLCSGKYAFGISFFIFLIKSISFFSTKKTIFLFLFVSSVANVINFSNGQLFFL